MAIVCHPMLENKALLSLYLSVKRKVSTCTVCEMFICAIAMYTLNFDHFASCHSLLY